MVAVSVTLRPGLLTPWKATTMAKHVLQVEMWLVAHRAVPGLLPGSKVGIAAGERVLMEVSRKFTEPCIADLAFRAGLCIQVRDGDVMCPCHDEYAGSARQ